MPKRKRILSKKKKAKKTSRKTNHKNPTKYILDNKDITDYNNLTIIDENYQKDNFNINSKEGHSIAKYCNLYEFNKNFLENDKYKDYIISNDIITKTITGNGNCFYNAISYYFTFIERI